MSKIGVIDIGSNSVRLVIFDALARAPHYVFNEKVQCRLGQGLQDTGQLSPQGVEMAKDCMSRFVSLARAMEVRKLDVVGTAALREASDGPAFVRELEQTLDIQIQIVDGETEAHLSALGVLVGWPEANGVVCDIGGSSMELVRVRDGNIGEGISLKLGPLKLMAMDAKERKSFINDQLKLASKVFGGAHLPIYLVGGSWRALGKVDMVRRDYPLPILHEYELTSKNIRKTVNFIQKRGAQVYDQADVSQGRAELMPYALEVLSRLEKQYEPSGYWVSAYGLREGLFFQHMPKHKRIADPLIEACRFLEKTLARFPGFGAALFEWIRPIFSNLNEGEMRLVQAACLLHDTNWRYHPDFRARISFDTVAQSNICAITHEGRIFLALALAARYANSASSYIPEKALSLLSEADRNLAVEVGHAMRLGAMISAGIQNYLAQTTLEIHDNELILSVSKGLSDISGQTVLKRLDALGSLNGKTVKIMIKDL